MRESVVAGDGCHARTGSRTSDPFAHPVTRPATADHGWAHGDVGRVGAAGSATLRRLGITTATAIDRHRQRRRHLGHCRRVPLRWQHVTGDFSIDTRVISLARTPTRGPKAGLMIRAAATDASSIHASIFVSPSKGIAYPAAHQPRRHPASSTPGPALTAPLWLRMTRQGARDHRASTGRTLTDALDACSAAQTIAALGDGVDVGLAVTQPRRRHAGDARSSPASSSPRCRPSPSLASAAAPADFTATARPTP